jgi:cysteine synthase B
MGTTGTIMGTSTYLKEKIQQFRLLGPTSGGSQICIRKWPKEYLPKIFDASKVDRIVEVSETEARHQRLALEEGILQE